MSLYLYNIGICFYDLLLCIVSWFNPKAKLLYKGRQATLQSFNTAVKNIPYTKKTYWFHVASLGEFEQARPLIEMLKDKSPSIKILLSFFSPSGYEIRKNYKFADDIIYLPSDSAKNARKLIETYKPDVAIFIKYEFWYHYLNELNKRNIPTFLAAAKFIPTQIFFKPWGGLFRKMLGFFDVIYVQDDISCSLLKEVTKTKVIKSGDTRFDRVVEIAKSTKTLEFIEKFCEAIPTVICGSTWLPDEELIFAYINQNTNKCRWIIAPHEINESHLKKIESLCKRPSIRYSTFASENIDEYKTKNFDVMILDTMGMLSSIYKYATFAYIGGGFGVGIHNTLEAAVYGLPVIWGPKYLRFTEAIELIAHNAAFSVSTQEELTNIFNTLLTDASKVKEMGEKSRFYVESKLGASELIVKSII